MKKLESIVAIIGFLALGLWACGKPPVRHSAGISTSDAVPVTDDPGGGDEPPGGEPGGLPPGTGLPMAVSLASFEANLYEPLLKPFCASCHDKTFVDQDPAKAHAAFLLRAGFDKYSGIDQTLPVLKMKQAHNCWDAQTKTCVTMMTEKMKLWMTDLEANGFKPVPLKYPFTSAEVMMSTAAPITVTAPAEYSGAGVDKATLAAPFTMGDNDIDGPIKFYASTPDTTPRLNAVNVAQ
ncbi:MAG: hypothetical protein NTX25_15955 [Proteobacteria bacterium]|nr:hypothetical protein [Pseudomonadota bacterium]